MIYQNYNKHFFYTAFAAILAVVLLAMSEEIVKSQRTEDTTSSPIKFRRFPEPQKDISNIISDSTSAAGSLIEKRTIDFSSIDAAYAVAVQTDGKIVAAGGVGIIGNNNYDFAVFRYNADGSLDTSFDADGKVTTSFNNYAEAAYTVIIQADGKIIAAGITDLSSNGNWRSALVRYNTDGSLDHSFGAGGKVLGAGREISEIALQPDGKIVAVGGNTIARYNGNGSLDATFGAGGIITTNFNARAFSVDIQADGKIVAAGDYTVFCDEEGCYYDFFLARYNTNGSPDTLFDGDGAVITDLLSYYDAAFAVAVQPDGKIVAAGTGYGNSGTFSFAVVRYNSDGSLDVSFDGDGIVTGIFGSYSNATSVVLQSGGKIVVSGTAYNTESNYASDFALVRLNPDGSLDTSLDADGKLTTDFGYYDFGNDVALQADGKIIAAGHSNSFLSTDFALSRYNTDGSLDAAFDGDGKLTTSWLVISSAANAVLIDERQDYISTFLVGYSGNGVNDDFAITQRVEYWNSNKMITPIGNGDDRANAAAFDPSGKIIAAGYSNNGSNKDFALVRYVPSTLGNEISIDTSFDGDGKLTTDFGGNDVATAVAVQPDGKILVAGYTTANGGTALILARYNNNGSLDASFGTNGRVIVPAIQNAKAMAIQPDGKIIAAGSTPHTVAPFGENFALARFLPNGSLDTSFDTDGIAITRFDNISRISALALQPYGKIVAAGYTAGSNFSMFALARYNADGSLDTSFDVDGKITTSVNGVFSSASAVRVQRNGKIVAVGSVLEEFGNDFALARYNLNGSLDSTFDLDGVQTTDFFGGEDYAFAAAIWRDGTIITAGSASRGGRTDFAAAFYAGDATRKVAYDFDDDGLADISLFRPSNSVWFLNRSTQGFTSFRFGISTDKLVPGDYDGDGKTDIAVFRDGFWYWLDSRFGTFNAVQFGQAGDIPVPADYDGDGRTELTVYRGGVWYTLSRFYNSFQAVQFGIATDKPVVGDYDGDGRADQAVYRDGTWYLRQSSLGFAAVQFGLPTDRLVPADYDGDGKTDLAVYRNGTWYLLQSVQGFAAFQFGIASDTPVPADYDGDGKTDAAVFRDGNWYLRQTTNGFFAMQFGLNNDVSVPSAFVP
jgi:uncharacterized delta-60 repeat protein